MTVANRSPAPTVQNLPDNRSSMSLISRSSTPTTPFGGFGLKLDSLAAIRDNLSEHVSQPLDSTLERLHCDADHSKVHIGLKALSSQVLRCSDLVVTVEADAEYRGRRHRCCSRST